MDVLAATKFNTLQPGENLYQIIAIDRQGQRSPVTELRLTYEGTAPAPAAETTVTANDSAANIEAVLDEFPPPRVTTPALFAADPTAVYQTSADRVTLFGEVPVGTNAVRVNGVKLRKFNPGDTKFQYTAIAMQEGENVYTIQALGPDDKFSETKVTVYYSPINLEG